MIRTRHKAWAHLIFNSYIRHLMRRHFNAFYLQGQVPSLPPDYPLLLLPNHSSWWDGFFIYFLNQHLFHRPLYLMMLEEQLIKYPFFSRVGAYSIRPQNAKGVLESLTYTLEILENPVAKPPLVCLFPQGELKPGSVRPLEIKSGYHWIIKRFSGELILLPLSIRLEFLDQQLPEVFFRLGEATICNREIYPPPEKLGDTITSLLENTDRNLIEFERGDLLLQGYASVNARWDRFRQVFKPKGKG